MKLPEPSAVLFDWDLTLVNSFSALAEAYNTALSAFNVPACTDEQIRAATAFSLKENFTRLFGDKWEEAADIFRSHYDAVHMNHVKLLDGAYELVSGISEKFGCPIGVVSNKTPGFLTTEIKFVGFDKFMSVSIGAGDAEHNKPHHAPVIMACEKLGLPADKSVWFVGDTVSDVKAANAAGCTSIIIGPREAVIEAENPDFYFADITEFRNKISEI